MKLLSFLPLLLLSLAASAAEKKPAAKAEKAVEAKRDDLSSYKTADDLWKHIEELREEPSVQPKSREEFISILTSWFGNQKAAADVFLKKFPEDPRRYSARLISVQSTMQLGRIPGHEGGAKDDPAELRKQIDAIIAAPDAPEEAKGEASFVRAMMLAEQFDAGKPETATAFLQTSEDFLAKYGGHKLAPQMNRARFDIVSELETAEADAALQKFAAGDDAELAAKAKQLLTRREKMRDLRTKPVELKFTATDGQEFDLEKLRGKVVLVDFWASWCGPCIAEMPNVTATYQKLHDQGFEIVGISLDQDKDAMDASIKKLGMTWRQYFDGKGWKNAISSTFGINSIPAAWLIDKKGMLRETSLRGEALGKGVAKLLAE